METEDLIKEDQQNYIEKNIQNRGPIKMNDTDLFLCTYQIGKFKSVMRINTLPDS